MNEESICDRCANQVNAKSDEPVTIRDTVKCCEFGRKPDGAGGSTCSRFTKKSREK